MEAVGLYVAAMLAVGLLFDWSRRYSIVAIGVWCAVAALALAANERWGWAAFYAACGLGGLIALSAESRLGSRQRGSPPPG